MARQTFQKTLTKNYIYKFRSRLLKWYDKNKRDLPWRNTQNPYHILVSEMMLQQTRVSQAEDYYRRFIAVFPDIETLAQNSVSRVLKMWEGLGYYARARNLHQTAKLITNHRHGQFPQTYEELITLPGIGPYTAAAVTSIAFNRPCPVIDGNVTRVLCRVFGIAKDPQREKTRHDLLYITSRLLSRSRTGIFNQALMEIGSTVCLPKTPRCSECCLRSLCFSRTLPDPTKLPIKTKKPAKPHFDVTAGFIWKGRKLLLARRREQGMLGGLWEFPGGKKESYETLQECLRREIEEELNVEVKVGNPIASIKHAFSHFRITLHGFHCRYLGGQVRSLGCSDWKWLYPLEVPTLALPRADIKLFEAWQRKKRD